LVGGWTDTAREAGGGEEEWEVGGTAADEGMRVEVDEQTAPCLEFEVIL
jgi:hypothetical protein